MTNSAAMLSPDVDPFRPMLLDDPYRHYQRIREQTPIYWNDFLGGWVLLRYADCKAALFDPRLSSTLTRNAQQAQLSDKLREQLAPTDAVLGRWMIFQDAQDHRRLRQLFGNAFSPRAIERMRARIQAIADGLIDEVQTRGEMDVANDFCARLTVMVMTDLLGAPLRDYELFRGWSHMLGLYFAIGAFGNETTIPTLVGMVREMSDYMRGIIAEHRRNPQDDLVSTLLASEEQGKSLGDDELLSQGLLLLTAGHDSSASTITSGVWHLLRNPEQARLLRDDPSLAEAAMEETMRYETVFQFVVRVAAEDLEIGGQAVRAGEQVVISLSAANHDPAQFPDPERFDIRRTPNPHIAFGHGPHFCLGAPLARLEGQIAFNTLLRRLPDIRLANETPSWRPTNAPRGLVTLPVVFTPVR